MNSLVNRVSTTSRGLLAAAAALAAACSVSESGNIPCVDDSNCPSAYPQCVAGKCVEAQALPDGGSGVSTASVAIVGVNGFAPTDVVSGAVRVSVTARASLGVKKVDLKVGTATVAQAADSAPPLFLFDVTTPAGQGSVTLQAVLTAGDEKTFTSADYALLFDNELPVLTLADPTPQAARRGSVITVNVTSTEPLSSVGGDVLLVATESSTTGTSVGTLSVVTSSGNSHKLAYAVPSTAAGGIYRFSVTGKDVAGNAAAAVAKTARVHAPFTLTSTAVSTGVTVAGQPAGKLATAFTVTVKVPIAVSLASPAAVFAFVDSRGVSRGLSGTATIATDATNSTITLADAIAAADASGGASVQVIVTDIAGNQASGAASLLVDKIVPALIGLAASPAVADATSGAPTGTITVAGTASEVIASASYTTSAGGSGTCLCDGVACSAAAASTTTVSCAVPVPTVTTPTALTVTVRTNDAVGNASTDSANQAAAQVVPLPVLTLGTPSPTSARPGTQVTVTVTSTQPLKTLGGSAVLVGSSDVPTSLSLLSGTLGVSTSYVVGFGVPANADAGVWRLTVSGTGLAGGAASAVTANTNVYLPFSVSSLAVTSSIVQGAVPAGATNAPINVTAKVPATAPLGAGAAVFSLVDAVGHSRTFAGAVSTGASGTSTTLTIADTISSSDVDGVASVRVTVTDLAGNSASASAPLIIDNARPFLVGLKPDRTQADKTNGTVVFNGTASKAINQATFAITAGGTGSGTCTCDGGTCASSTSTAPTVSCPVTIPTVAADTTVTVAVTIQDLLGNTSLAANNSASFLDVGVPTSTGFAPSSTTITLGSNATLTPTFSNGIGTVTNNTSNTILAVTSGSPMVVSPTSTTVYTLSVRNSLGTALTTSPTATVTVTPVLSFAATYVPVSGSPTPGAMVSGATTGSLTFSIPTFVGFTPGSFTAAILGANNVPVVHADNSLVSSAEIIAAQNGTVTNVKIPVTDAADVRTLVYTLRLTVSGVDSDTFANLQLIPQVVLSGSTLLLTPATITGGSTVAITVRLPKFSGSTAQTLSLRDQFGTAPFKFGTTTPVSSDDLFANGNGSTLQVAPPLSTPTDASKTYNYTLTASNAASSVTQTSNLAIIPAVIALNAGDGQTGVQGTLLATPLKVKVTDNNNAGVQGVTVNWSAVTGGGSVTSTTSVTDSGGFAQVGAILGAAGGTNTYRATVAGLTGSPITFTATSAANIAISAGDGQVAVKGTTLPTNLAVLVTTNGTTPVQGITVNWAVTSGGGSVSSTSSVTSAGGIASVGATLGATGGTNTYTATVAGLTGSPLTFTATGAGNMALNGGDGQVAVKGTTLPTNLSVLVTTNGTTPVQGITVNWSVISGGGSVSSTTSVTNVSGIASVGATLGNASGGTNTYRATVAGLTGSPVNFTAIAGGNIALNGGDGQVAVKGTTLPTNLSVLVTTNGTTPVQGITVNWSVVSGGGSVSSSTSVSDASGIAQVGATLGAAGGTNSYRATVSGLTGSPINFTATGAGNIAVSTGDNQVAVKGTTLPTNLAVLVTTNGTTPVQGITVNWAVASGGGSVSSTSSVTNAGGIASVGATLGATGGTNTFTATAGGLTGSPVTFTAVGAGNIALDAGDNQVAVKATTLPTNLSVLVTTNGTTPVQGLTVNWSVTGGGGSVSSTTSQTNASGIASIGATLGASGGTNTYRATVAGLTGSPINFTATGAGNIALNAGNNQVGVKSSTLPTNLSVLVTTNGTTPVQGISVAWSVTGGGGSVSSTTTLTDASGIASVGATLGSSGGTNTYRATVAGLTGSPINFTATGAGNIAINAGNNQVGPKSSTLPTALSVLVTTNGTTPVQGISVNWAVASGGGSVSSTSSLTDASGIASVGATLGSSGGANSYTATVAGLTGSPLTFNATAAGNIAISAGDGQAGVKSTTLPTNLAVLVTTNGTTPVAGITVNWAVTGGGGSVSSTTSQTNGSGIASIGATLGSSGGTNTYTASVSGLTGSPVTFTATAAGNLALNGGDNQVGVKASTLPTNLSVLVTTNGTTPVPGISVAWSVTGGGGSVSSTNTTTDGSGIASVGATLGAAGGTNTYRATVAGLTGSPINFTATAAGNIAVNTGNNQTGVVSTTLASPLVVKVTTNGTTAVQGITVNWATTGGGGNVSGATSVTDAGGLAQINATLGATGGTNTYTATVAGLTGSPVSFTATAAAQIALSAGDGQVGTAGVALTNPLVVKVSTNGTTGVTGIVVNWSVTGGGGSIAASSTTDGSGLAQVTPTLGAAGTNTFQAAVTGLTGSPVSFSANAVAAPSFGPGSLSVVPNVYVGGKNPTLAFSLPALTAGAASSTTFAVSPAGNPTNKINGSAIGVSDLGTTVNVTSTTTATASTAAALYTYTLTATNQAGTATSTAATVQMLRGQSSFSSALQRVGASATLLPDGKVLVAGGGRKTNNTDCTIVGTTSKSAELYDPATGVSTTLGTSMSIERCQHAAVLAGTKVYFFGGNPGNATTTIDVYDTVAGTFQTSSLPVLTVARLAPTATLLGASAGSNSGKIVVAGGFSSASAALNSMELFTPGGTATAYTAQLGGTLGRGDHSATLAGKWLVFVGGHGGGSTTSSADAIDTTLPASGGGAATTVTSYPSGGVQRWGHAAAILSSGTDILLAGGLDNTSALLNSVQVYTVSSTSGIVESATAAVTMTNARAYFPILLTRTANKFIVVGGLSNPGTTDVGSTSVELIDATNKAAVTASAYGGGNLAVVRQESAAVNLNLSGASNFAFLVAGGDPGGGSGSAGTVEVLIDP